jgi:AraC family transcriptional regulator
LEGLNLKIRASAPPQPAENKAKEQTEPLWCLSLQAWRDSSAWECPTTRIRLVCNLLKMRAYPERPTSGVIVRKLDTAGLQLSEHSYDEGVELQKHWHGNSFLTFTLRGGCRETFPRRQEDCLSQTVRFLPAGELHSNAYESETRCLHVEIPTSFLSDVYQYSNRTLGPGLIRRPAAAAIARRLYREFLDPDDLSTISIKSLTLELLVEAHRTNRPFADRPRWLCTVLEVVQDRFSERVTLANLAAAVGVHPVHLCRGFHRYQGCTLGEFVRNLRVQRACELLTRTNSPLSDIALAVGCSDQSHLSSLFKKHLGSTPGQYRRIFGSEQAASPISLDGPPQ